MTNLSEMNIYENIRHTVQESQKKVYSTVNFVMVETYWDIGKQICEAQGENNRAEYGAGLLKYLSEKLTEEFGRGYTATNLKYMRQFYITFPNRHSLRDQLNWILRHFYVAFQNCASLRHELEHIFFSKMARTAFHFKLKD